MLKLLFAAVANLLSYPERSRSTLHLSLPIEFLTNYADSSYVGANLSRPIPPTDKITTNFAYPQNHNFRYNRNDISNVFPGFPRHFFALNQFIYHI